MAYDMSRCPQTTDEFRDYFYQLIGRSLGASANDFEVVLSASYPWNGQMLMIPVGVGPGVRQFPDAPFYGLTQQYSGQPKARVFLPSNTPDELGYYTRCMQYVDDAVGTYSKFKSQPTAQSSGLVWAWYLAGPDNAYNPVLPADGSIPVPPSGGISREEVEAMLVNYFKVDDKIALESASGKIICAEGGGPVNSNEPYIFTSRSNVGPWESYRILRGQ